MRVIQGRFLALSALVVVASTAWATETTVKNDAVVDFSNSAVQAGFVAGESAAAWLTSPCDGTIVAVQVFWYDNDELSSGAQSLEDSITISEAGTFPNPGAVLAFLEAPFLTEGFANEFRFLDENNTIPINVPVTNGQVFVVSFKFAESPNPLAGPSVVTDVNGCRPNKNGIFAIPPGIWFNACALGVSGDFAIRAVIDCGDPEGACCLPDGSCQQMTASDCSTNNGTYQGDLSNCGSVTCPQPEGACCFDGGGCLNFTEADCTTATGTWQGPGTDCSAPGFTCNPIGACCLPDGGCLDNVSPADCTTAGGVFQGDGTDCGTANCPLPSGACCFSSGGCLVLTSANCAIANGTWMGLGTDCVDGDGSGTADDCEGGGGCTGDVNGDLTVDLTDLAILLANFDLSPADPNQGDVNNDDTVDLTDLAILLANFDMICP